MYDKFAELLQIHNTTAYQVAKATGIGQSTLSDWKSGRSVPKIDKLKKIADYFGVSVNYFTEDDKKEKPAALEDDELSEYLEELKNRPEMRMLFSLTKGATKEEVERAVRIVEAALGKWGHMNQIFVRGIEMPGSVRGVTAMVQDDFFVFINSCLSPEAQKEATLHEVRHIKLEHFYNQDPVIINEFEAQG